MTSQELIEARGHSSNNREEIKKSKYVGCFYCINIYSPKDIKEWVGLSERALCPRCGIDAVIGSASGHNIDKNFLLEMERMWFSRAIDLQGNVYYLKNGKFVKG